MGKAVAVTGVRRRMRELDFFPAHHGRRDMAAGQRGHIHSPQVGKSFEKAGGPLSWECAVGLAVTQKRCLLTPNVPSDIRTSGLGDSHCLVQEKSFYGSLVHCPPKQGPTLEGETVSSLGTKEKVHGVREQCVPAGDKAIRTEIPGNS